MPAYVALFRAVNVGGRGTVSMRDLCAIVAKLGFGDPRTLLQSGNLVFSSADADPLALESSLERAVKTGLGLETCVLVRSAETWAALVATNPYPEFARNDPSHLVAMPLNDMPSDEAKASLQAAIVGRETFAAIDATLYLTYPDGIGRSKLTTAVVERRLGVVGTARNWNTVLRIAAALAG